MSKSPDVIIYADGSACPNPGSGGAGVVLIFGKNRRYISQYLGENIGSIEAELLAAIYALRALTTECRVLLKSDSAELVNGMNDPTTRSRYSRVDHLWQALDELCARHTVTFRKIKGHRGIRGNEQADHLASKAARSRRSDSYRFMTVKEGE